MDEDQVVTELQVAVAQLRELVVELLITNEALRFEMQRLEQHGLKTIPAWNPSGYAPAPEKISTADRGPAHI